MSKTELQNELNKSFSEPLLPIERKLIGWSLGTGIVLLIVLAAVNRLYPI